jgi:hypothetical protein
MQAVSVKNFGSGEKRKSRSESLGKEKGRDIPKAIKNAIGNKS